MKYVGIALIAIGFALLIFVLYNFIKSQNKFASPVPQDQGVKVIFVTPPNK